MAFTWDNQEKLRILQPETEITISQATSKYTPMKKQELYHKVIDYFEQTMPVAETELHYNNPFQLLVAVILSAQCTDKRVNMVTPELFRDFPDPETMAASNPDVLFNYIRSISYPNNKAKHLWGMANMLVNEYHSEVPSDLDQLVRLPGVGRKTANVIQAVIFEKAAMAVDTHVFRVSHRHRSCSGTLHHSIQRREGTCTEFPCRTDPQSPPLAYPARTLYLHSPPT